MRTRQCVALAALLIFAAPAVAAPAGDGSLGMFERLSLDLRNQPLDAAERTQLREALRAGQPPDALYSARRRAWTSPTFYSDVAEVAYLESLYKTNGAALFSGTLAHKQVGRADVFFLPHRTADGGRGKVPCPASERVAVHPWWAPASTVLVCKASHAPEQAFDKIGYCGGQQEPLLVSAPRPDCGCGPALLACLPPDDVVPHLVDALTESLWNEAFETMKAVVEANRPFDEVTTATRTWQTGLAKLVYLRRELVGLLASRPYSPALEQEIVDRLKTVDLEAPGEWVERRGLYAGSGLLGIPAMHTIGATYRVQAVSDFKRELCVDFKSVNVDSVSLRKAVGEAHGNLRGFGLESSPMREQLGCKGCHAILDNGAAMLQGLATPLRGSFPTDNQARGSLYVLGASDLRGQGAGMAELARLMVRQPEYGRCLVTRSFSTLMRRQPLAAERAFVDRLVADFDKGGHRMAPLIDAILESPGYKHPLDVVPAVAVRSSPAAVQGRLNRYCVRCHNGEVEDLDLRKLPAPTDVATWSRMLEKVETSKMPPPESGSVAAHFPLDPEERRRLVADLQGQLVGHLDEHVRPLHVTPLYWAQRVTAVFPQVSLDRIEAYFGARGVALSTPDAIWPFEQLGLEDISRDVCQAAYPGATRKLKKRPARWSPEIAEATRVALEEAVFGAAAAGPSSTGLVGARTYQQGWIRTCAVTLASVRMLHEHYLDGDR